MIYLPDPQNGYYRASRFDWSGVVPCLTYKGHTYFGVWFQHYDPMIADSITGPVEEFRSVDGGMHYADAKPGELFVKIGVGTLRKMSDKPYQFMTHYPLVDGGRWKVKVKRNEVIFTQTLRSPLGIAYVYEKILKLDKDKPILTLEHHLKNTGSVAIDTEVYDHDFFMLDNAPTGPGMVIHFNFPPKNDRPLDPGAEVVGKDIVYRQELQTKQTVTSYLTGFSDSSSDYDFTLENTSSGAGVEQSGDRPLSRFNLWSIRPTICPEAYVHLNILPGDTQSWNIHYHFFTK
ncbi:hypothetical protein [Paracidobacterium acidisoli]|uniref:hypothetical protein n=1 Tax=Paracidobacterium acidisoli TaxID=2303751 RepID=UPI0011C15D52|nr:hypothetical protein [Paracidobacterium acidisoli]MBT9332397.1 hypothetical protein [Paracidobacterium acidisoli]